MRRKEFDKKERIDALKEGYDKMGKGGGLWYMIDDNDCKEFGFKKLTPKPGNVFLAILPRPDNPKFFEEIYVHYGIGPNQYAFLCPNKMYGEDCPICTYRKELLDRDEPDEVLRLFSYTKRILLWVVNVENNRGVDEGVYIYDAPNGVLKGIAGQTKDTRTGEIIDISDPVEDLELQFVRTGKDMHTKYDSFKVERRQEEIPEDYYEVPIDMIDVIIQPDIDAMEKALGITGKKGRDAGNEGAPLRDAGSEDALLREEKDVNTTSNLRRESEPEEEVPSERKISRGDTIRKRERNDERKEEVFPDKEDEKTIRQKRIRNTIDKRRELRQDDDLPF